MDRIKDHLKSVLFAFIIWVPLVYFGDHELMTKMIGLAVFYIFWKQYNQYPSDTLPPRRGEQRYG